MKPITSLLLLLFTSIGFSQTEKMISGKVKTSALALAGVDIVNATSKKSTTSNTNGIFTISAKEGDLLLVFSKEYTDQAITLTSKEMNSRSLIVNLEKTTIELNEVNVAKTSSLQVKPTQTELAQAKLEKEANSPKVVGVYDGRTEYGLDFVQIGNAIGKLFKGDKTNEPKTAVTFTEYAAAVFATDFYTKQLKLQPDEISLFLTFCEADPKAKAIVANHEPLETTDFLISKNEEFKKLKR